MYSVIYNRPPQKKKTRFQHQQRGQEQPVCWYAGTIQTLTVSHRCPAGTAQPVHGHLPCFLSLSEDNLDNYD